MLHCQNNVRFYVYSLYRHHHTPLGERV